MAKKVVKAHKELIESKIKIKIVETIRKKKLNIHTLSKKVNRAYSTIWEHVGWLINNGIVEQEEGILLVNEINLKKYVLENNKYLEKIQELKILLSMCPEKIIELERLTNN